MQKKKEKWEKKKDDHMKKQITEEKARQLKTKKFIKESESYV